MLVGYIVFIAKDLNIIALPHVGPSSCKALGIRIYWPGLSNIGKILPLVFVCLISRLLYSHPHIYLGLMGVSRRCRLLGLVGKNCPPLSLPALFQGFWILTLISTLGPWGYPPVVDFLDLSAKMCIFFAVSFTPIAPPRAGLYSEPLFLESLWHQA